MHVMMWPTDSFVTQDVLFNCVFFLPLMTHVGRAGLSPASCVSMMLLWSGRQSCWHWQLPWLAWPVLFIRLLWAVVWGSSYSQTSDLVGSF